MLALRLPTLCSLLRTLLFKLELTFNIGPLKTVFFRFAKTRPGEGIAPAKARSSKVEGRFKGGGVVRTRRTFEGNAEVVGVAGRTLRELWGERAVGRGLFMAEDMTELELDEVDEVLECACAWCMLRIDETEEEVDFLPRKPAEERLYVDECGVSGAGDIEFRGFA